MDFTYLTLVLCICAVTSYPSKPLNDRPSDLAWQAWLLVDSQNNPGETDRRITPKSVFIAPKLGQDNGSLPDCADGYRSDPMGRCIKFVKVDEAAHLDFLLERLNAMYATKSSAETDDDEVKPTSGPLQVNIPFGVGFQSAEEPETDPEIAIIVAPTNGNFDVDESEAKVNVKRTHNATQDVQSDSTMATVEESTVETTTFEAPTPTTTEPTRDDLQALFFLVPMNKSTHVDATDSSSSTEEGTTAEADTTESTPADTKAKLDPESDELVSAPAAAAAAAPFAEPIRVEESPTYVRPPDVVQLPQGAEPHRLTSGEIQELFRQYIQQNPEVVALTASEKHPARRRPQSEATYTDGEAVQVHRPQYYGPASFNHRNRDRNSEFWRPVQEDSGQKPLVLRFGRYPATAAGGRFSPERATYLEERQQQQQQQRLQEFGSPFGRTRRRGNVR